MEFAEDSMLESELNCSVMKVKISWLERNIETKPSEEVDRAQSLIDDFHPDMNIEEFGTVAASHGFEVVPIWVSSTKGLIRLYTSSGYNKIGDGASREEAFEMVKSRISEYGLAGLGFAEE